MPWSHVVVTCQPNTERLVAGGTVDDTVFATGHAGRHATTNPVAGSGRCRRSTLNDDVTGAHLRSVTSKNSSGGVAVVKLAYVLLICTTVGNTCVRRAGTTAVDVRDEGAT